MTGERPRRLTAAPNARASHSENRGHQTKGDFSYAYTHHATRLHSDLLDGYQKAVPPSSSRSPAQNYSTQAGTDVTLQMRFLKVERIDITRGAMQARKQRVARRATLIDGNGTAARFRVRCTQSQRTCGSWLPATRLICADRSERTPACTHDGNIPRRVSYSTQQDADIQ